MRSEDGGEREMMFFKERNELAEQAEKWIEKNGVENSALSVISYLSSVGRLKEERWTPASKLPEEEGDYLCWEWQGFYYIDTFKGGKWELEKETGAKCIAWMPLPEPYTEGNKG